MSAGTIRCGIIEGSELFEPLQRCYDLMASYFREDNISIIFIPTPHAEFAEIRNAGDDLPESMDAFWFPVNIGDFIVNGKPTIRRMTNVHFSASGMIVSSAPQIIKQPSLSSLYMELEFSLAFMTSLFVVSVFLWIASRLLVPNKSVSRPPSFFNTVWANLLLFFYEPYIWVPRIVSWRMAAMVWLIAMTVIFVDISSNLKSDFTESIYDTIDTVDDLITKRKPSDIYFVDGSDELEFFQRKAQTEKNFAKLMEGIPESSIESFLDFGDKLKEVPSGKSIIISSFHIQALLMTNPDIVNSFDNAGMFYFSPSFENTLLVYPLSNNFSRSELMEVVNRKIGTGVAMKMDHPIFIEVAYAWEIMKWQESGESFADISIVEIESLLYVYFVGSAAGCVVFLLQITFYLISSLKCSQNNIYMVVV